MEASRYPAAKGRVLDQIPSLDSQREQPDYHSRGPSSAADICGAIMAPQETNTNSKKSICCVTCQPIPVIISFLHCGRWVQRFDTPSTNTGHQAMPDVHQTRTQWYLLCTPALPSISTSDQVSWYVDHPGFLSPHQGSVPAQAVSSFREPKGHMSIPRKVSGCHKMPGFQRCPTVDWMGPIKSEASPEPHLPLGGPSLPLSPECPISVLDTPIHLRACPGPVPPSVPGCV